MYFKKHDQIALRDTKNLEPGAKEWIVGRPGDEDGLAHSIGGNFGEKC